MFTLHKAEEIRLQVAAVTAKDGRRRALAQMRAGRVRRIFLQLSLWGEPTPVSCWVRPKRKGAAKPARAVARAVACDVFAFAALGMHIAVGRGSSERAIRRIVTREDGITKHVAVREQDTPEWAERERQRRARQRPPRTGTRKVKKAIRHWGMFSGEDDGAAE